MEGWLAQRLSVDTPVVVSPCPTPAGFAVLIFPPLATSEKY